MNQPSTRLTTASRLNGLPQPGTDRLTTEEDFLRTVVTQAGRGRGEPDNGRWTGVGLAVTLGCSKTKSSQVAIPAYEKVALCGLADAARTLATIAWYMQHPTPRMLETVKRRNARLAADHAEWKRRQGGEQ